jgi:hypothetical protein
MVTITLWEGDREIARMTERGDKVWKLTLYMTDRQWEQLVKLECTDSGKRDGTVAIFGARA